MIVIREKNVPEEVGKLERWLQNNIAALESGAS